MSLKIEKTEMETSGSEIFGVFARLDAGNVWQRFFFDAGQQLEQKVAFSFGDYSVWTLDKTLKIIKMYMPQYFLKAETSLRECLWKCFPRALNSLIMFSPSNNWFHMSPPDKIYYDRKQFDALDHTYENILRLTHLWSSLWNLLQSQSQETRKEFTFAMTQAQQCWIKSFLSNPKHLARTDGIVLRREVLDRTAFPFDNEDSRYRAWQETKNKSKAQAYTLQTSASSATATTATTTTNQNLTFGAMVGRSGETKQTTTPLKFGKVEVPLFAGRVASQQPDKRNAGKCKHKVPPKKKRLSFKIGTIDKFRTSSLWLALKLAWIAHSKLPRKSAISTKLKKYLSQIESIMRVPDVQHTRKRLLLLVAQAEKALNTKRMNNE